MERGPNPRSPHSVPVTHGCFVRLRVTREALSIVSSQSAAYLLRVVASAGEEANTSRPFRPVGCVPGPESTPECPLGLVTPGGVALVETLGADCVLDSPAAELLTNADRPVASFTARGYVLLREAPIRQPVPDLEVFEHPLDRLRVEAAHRKLGLQLGARVLAACEQFERLPTCPVERLLSAQAPASSRLSAFAFSRPSKRSRSSESRLWATSSCSRRKLRTLSRPCPMRSPR